MLRKLVSLCLGLGMIVALSSATVIAPNSTNSTTVSPASACSCFAADFKWKPNFQTLACDAFFKATLVPQPCFSTIIAPQFEIKSVTWSFGDGNTGSGQSVYHIYGGPCPAPPTIVCATINAIVSNGITKEKCTYTVCKPIALQ
ncbi:MAG: hypothetical protein ACFB10_19750 [Salibacteraceae bacterium]